MDLSKSMHIDIYNRTPAKREFRKFDKILRAGDADIFQSCEVTEAGEYEYVFDVMYDGLAPGRVVAVGLANAHVTVTPGLERSIGKRAFNKGERFIARLTTLDGSVELYRVNLSINKL